MNEIRNLSKKRVGDVSEDRRMFVIQIKDCITRIRANADGTLEITHEHVKPAV